MDPSVAAAPSPAVSAAHEPNVRRSRPKRRKRSHAIDKSVLAMSEPRRLRDRDHVRSVAQHPCLICGRRPDAHHLRFAQSRALGRKVSDEFTVPLCRGHQREVHRCGDEDSGGGMLVSTRPWQPAHSGSKTTRCEVVWKILLDPATTDGAPIDGAAKSLAYLEQRRTLNNGSRRPEHHWRVRWRRPSAAAAMREPGPMLGAIDLGIADNPGAPGRTRR